MDNVTIEYRLDNIEKTLSDLKNVIVENKLQNREIELMSEKINGLENAINAHDKRIKDCEIYPIKSRAGKFATIADIAFKAIISAGVTLLLAKGGIL